MGRHLHSCYFNVARSCCVVLGLLLWGGGVGSLFMEANWLWFVTTISIMLVWFLFSILGFEKRDSTG